MGIDLSVKTELASDFAPLNVMCVVSLFCVFFKNTYYMYESLEFRRVSRIVGMDPHLVNDKTYRDTLEDRLSD